MSKTFRGYVPIEAPTFDLESPDGARKVTIKCVGMLPGKRFLDFLGNLSGNDQMAMAAGINNLFKAAIKEESYQTFQDFCDVPENGIGLELLSEIAGHIGELYSGRPTRPSAPSSDG